MRADTWRVEPEAFKALEWPWSLWAAVSEEEIRRAARMCREEARDEPLHVIDAGTGWTPDRGPELRVTIRRVRSEVTVLVDVRSGVARRG